MAELHSQGVETGQYPQLSGHWACHLIVGKEAALHHQAQQQHRQGWQAATSAATTCLLSGTSQQQPALSHT